MTTIQTTYQIRPIAPAVAAELRTLDDASRGPRVIADSEGGSPLRCCLRASRPGETIALVSYAPLRRWAAERGVDPGGYDETGPVFIHATECAGYGGEGYPEDFRGSRRMLRAYRGDGSIMSGRLLDPDERPEEVIASLFADDEVAVVHARAVEFGCFTFEIRRPTTDQQP
jgi:hypothetical protein